uniref:HIT domain-containing protein n=1 Tax=Chromera velia CCMP2878 TaxID=1169474 RepID=A0A0G4HAU3_9ALVE|eukprot:Cvel_25653.t1-p1 / transcript=Cvel_25653.t1 / gene=Cvel_25653 / organism=Chromera_velia_CCMP2878 / gene_product=Nitrilase and fragile histidine triad fusion, putative / transcript_product=Nitrilase and fragile histidine triad fusion, putative / location=Cvel_scaffold2936:18193-21148(+) / protein_length=236 / sequence_SO=supercontig / SO=protein_coding / is_pseudo=false
MHINHPHKGGTETAVSRTDFLEDPDITKRFAESKERVENALKTSSQKGQGQEAEEGGRDSCSFPFGPFRIPKEHVFLLSEKSMAFVNLKPFVEGHVLVAPQTVVKELTSLEEEELLDLIGLGHLTSVLLSFVFAKAYKISVVVQDGETAGQTVPHVHFHLVPSCPPGSGSASADAPIPGKENKSRTAEDPGDPFVSLCDEEKDMTGGGRDGRMGEDKEGGGPTGSIRPDVDERRSA